MTGNQLLQAIRLGEDDTLELKEVRITGAKIKGPVQNVLADEVAAFANSRGGVLVLGVQDKTREVLGIPINMLDAVEMLVVQACEASIDPPVFPVVKRLTLPNSVGEERAVIAVDVPRSLFVHRSYGGYFLRVGSSKRIIPPSQLARLFEQRSRSQMIRFDETPVWKAALSDLDIELWRRFTSMYSEETPEILLSKLAMVSNDDDDVLHPTIAGILMACKTPEEFMPNAFIQAVAYRGVTISPSSNSMYQRDARDITGPLDQQILSACAFVRNNMRIAAMKGADGGREDIPQFDMVAVFEAVTNAVAHRDYSIAGSKIRLRLFDDRLELYTPGQLVNSMSPESLPFRQATRNDTIASLLTRCEVKHDDFRGRRKHIMDRRGEGVPLILSRSETLSGKKPEHRMIDDSELLLTIFAPTVS